MCTGHINYITSTVEGWSESSEQLSYHVQPLSIMAEFRIKRMLSVNLFKIYLKGVREWSIKFSF